MTDLHYYRGCCGSVEWIEVEWCDECQWYGSPYHPYAPHAQHATRIIPASVQQYGPAQGRKMFLHPERER